jgi:hypothetical protein
MRKKSEDDCSVAHIKKSLTRAGGVIQLVEHLPSKPSKREVLSSNPSTTKKSSLTEAEIWWVLEEMKGDRLLEVFDCY